VKGKVYHVKRITGALTAVLLCTILAGCSQEQTEQSGETSYPQDTALSSEIAVLPQNSAADKESAEPAYSAPDINIRECNFIPVLKEDDIDYMGKPYRDLTAEEFIQLWAQSRREYNVQRLYVMSYDNTVNGEDEKSVIKEDMETILCMEYIGRMMCGYYDVELLELEEAPEGYYDNEDEELHYCVTFQNIRNIDGMISEYSDMNWITLRKIDGYWKIGIMRDSSPYFFDTSRLYGTAGAG